MGSFQAPILALPREREPPPGGRRVGGGMEAGRGRGGRGRTGAPDLPPSPSRVRAAAWRPAQVPPRDVCI